MLNSRDRVLAAIDHKQVDRFPIDIGGPISGVSKIAYDKYLQKYVPSLYPSEICDKFQQLGYLHEKILEKWQVDTWHVVAGFDPKIDTDSFFIDAFGTKYQRVYSSYINNTLYFDQVEWPLSKTRKIEDIENFSWPKLPRGKIDEIKLRLQEFRNNELCTILDAPYGGILETCTFTVGISNFYSDFYAHKDFFESLIDHITHTFFEPYWQDVLAELGELVDVVLIGDDFGMQDKMIISPQLFRKFVKPKLKAVVSTIKTSANVQVMLHSCGSIFPIIPDIIDIGFNILNPLQPRAAEMDHHIIKEKYGKELCFHGGTDIQYVMPRGKPEEVEKEVKRVISTLGSDGTGYILATAHNTLADVPPENIHAFVTAKRFL